MKGKKSSNLIKELTGTLRQDRVRLSPALNPLVKVPKAQYLTDKEAIAIYIKTASYLVKNRIIEPVDTILLEAYCGMVARFNLCERMIKEQGEILTTTTPKGIVRTYPNPYIKMGMDSLRSANELARQYGLNPLSRDRLNIESQKTENTNDSYFN